jgi:chlorobactene glucosyltransferase
MISLTSLSDLWGVWLAVLPWILLPLIGAIRATKSRNLRDESSTAPNNPPLVSIIIPARNEAKNIEACVRSALATTYPKIEIIVVNDHSTDDTATIVHQIANTDPRVRVIENPDLPRGWFGKQWACQNGANAASGNIFLFLDADTRMMPEALTRSVNGMLRERADLYTVLTRQEMHTFWERLLQPQIFSILHVRYGGTEIVNASKRVSDKIANGQYLMFPRSTYQAMQGHSLVRSYVAEDLKFAQLYFAAGKKTIVINGMQDVSTRMYTNLEEVITGWRKNVYAGGRDAVPFGRIGQILFPFVLPSAPLFQLVPVISLLLGIFNLLSPPIVLWAALTSTIMLVYWTIGYLISRNSPLYALAYPIGAAVTFYILLSATLKGNKVSWKGRDYISNKTTP